MTEGAATAQAPVAVVTGGADGIGLAVARRFAQAGCTVVIAGLDEASAVARAAELGERHRGLGLDVAEPASVAAGVASILARHGRIDMLVNNAGIADMHKPTLEQDDDAFDRILRVNLNGVFTVSREVGRA